MLAYISDKDLFAEFYRYFFFNERAIFFAFNVHSENLGPMTVNSFPWMASYYYFGLINLQEKARSETSI